MFGHLILTGGAYAAREVLRWAKRRTAPPPERTAFHGMLDPLLSSEFASRLEAPKSPEPDIPCLFCKAMVKPGEAHDCRRAEGSAYGK